MAKRAPKKVNENKRLEIKEQIKNLESQLKRIPQICNKCGKSCKTDGKSTSENYGLIDAKVNGGYYSEKLEDGCSYSFSLCEPCLWDLFESCKVKPNAKERWGF
jgi:hypothetical protein